MQFEDVGAFRPEVASRHSQDGSQSGVQFFAFVEFAGGAGDEVLAAQVSFKLLLQLDVLREVHDEFQTGRAVAPVDELCPEVEVPAVGGGAFGALVSVKGERL